MFFERPTTQLMPVLLAALPLLLLFAGESAAQCAPGAFINEFHYDDISSTSNEAAEIILPPGEDAALYHFQMYSGSDGVRKKNELLSDHTATDIGSGFRAIHVPVVLQNADEGIALVKDCNGVTIVVDFLCYEAAFSPAAGTAIEGTTCSLVMETTVDVTDPLPLGKSYQRTGDGGSTSWVVADTTWGALNSGQSLPAVTNCCIDCAAAPCTSWFQGTLSEPQPMTYYLDKAGGSDLNDGLSPETAFQSAHKAVDSLKAGDTLKIVGEYSNPSYDPSYTFTSVNDTHLWHGENTLSISNVHGAPGKWITITAHDATTVLRGDGGNIVRISDSSYVRVVGLDVHGEVDRIPLSTAKAVQFVYRDVADGPIKYRVDPTLTDAEINALSLPIIGSIVRASYTDTRGLYASNSHHLVIEGNHIHHVPGNGLRCAYCEYTDVMENEIDNCARKSYSGTHGLVLTYTLDTMPQETADNYRMRVVRNKIHHVYNEIYSWVGSKAFIHAAIDEGKGISLQRNQEFSNGGRILVANNLAYWNGYSGVHSNDGDNVDMFGNTAYLNSYTNTIWYNATGGEQTGKNIGISLSEGRNNRMMNNIVVVDAGFNGFALSISGDNTDTFTIANNLIWGVPVNTPSTLNIDSEVTAIAENTTVADPLFVDTGPGIDPSYASYDFGLQAGSPAIGAARSAFVPCEDYYGKMRREDPARGAIEYRSDELSASGDAANITRCYKLPYQGARAPNAAGKMWGKAAYGHCELLASWPELANYETGGLGKLMDAEYEVWVCMHGHACDPAGSFCFVYSESEDKFIPWGPNSQLRLF